MTILVASMGATFLMAVKALIHKIDAFVVLPHEAGDKDSYLNKMHKMGKLKANAKFGHRLGWSEHKDGRERHLHPEHGEGVRNPDTGGKSSILPKYAFFGHLSCTEEMLTTTLYQLSITTTAKFTETSPTNNNSLIPTSSIN
jgi:hypothetical protein